MRTIISVTGILFLVLFGNCSRRVLINSYASPPVEFGSMRIPKNKIADFKRAEDLVVKVIYSSELKLELQKYIQIHKRGGAYSAAWKNCNADSIIKDLKFAIQGVSIITYRGPRALWLYYVYGNVAYDGTTDGPIRINATRIKKRDQDDFANTIAHELSHRIGLTHPHSDDNLSISNCEPPYVIGSIVEKLAMGDNWKWSDEECPHLKT